MNLLHSCWLSIDSGRVYFLRWNPTYVNPPDVRPTPQWPKVGRWELLREDNENGTWTEGPTPAYFNTLVEEGRFKDITLEWMVGL